VDGYSPKTSQKPRAIKILKAISLKSLALPTGIEPVFQP
jgi:hypothetical protein